MVWMVQDTRITRIADTQQARSVSLEKQMGNPIDHPVGDILIIEKTLKCCTSLYTGTHTKNPNLIGTFRLKGLNKIIHGFKMDDPNALVAQW